MIRSNSLDVSLRVIIILFLVFGCPGQSAPVHAQAGSIDLFGTPELDNFPTIRFYFDIFDAEGNFVEDIQPTDVEVIENNQSLAPQNATEIENGLQIIVAINISPEMGTVSNGSTGYQRIIQALQTWSTAIPETTLDDFSLATPTGLHLIRDRDPEKFSQSLEEYQPDFEKNQPSLNSLSEGLDLATDPLGRPLLKRSILFITPALPTTNVANLPDLAVRAQEAGVQVNVWMIGKPVNVSEGAPDPLMEFAESTGGEYVQIVSTETLPEIEPFFSPLRRTYQVEYQSGIQASGTQSLKVKVTNQASSLVSDTQRFSLEVDPPNPIFLSPPTQLQRSWIILEDEQKTSVLTPDTIPLQIVVEFPDGRVRPLQATRLYVNGVMVAENTSEPFDQFEWSISDISAPGQMLIRVEAIDILGLNGSSVDVPVEVLIDQSATTRLANQFSGKGLIAVVAVAISGSVLAFILVFTSARRRSGWKRKQLNKKRNKDPLTQPVEVQPIPPRKPRPLFGDSKPVETSAGPFWPKNNTTSAPARLVTLDENEQPVTGGVLPLSRQEITFGSDPKRATQVLNSPTVDGLHARLYRSQEGEFSLADQNSIAGTWINYAPVNSNGARLEHGDLIHIGKLMFRFELADPSQALLPPEVQVIELEQSHDPR